MHYKNLEFNAYYMLKRQKELQKFTFLSFQISYEKNCSANVMLPIYTTGPVI